MWPVPLKLCFKQWIYSVYNYQVLIFLIIYFYSNKIQPFITCNISGNLIVNFPLPFARFQLEKLMIFFRRKMQIIINCKPRDLDRTQIFGSSKNYTPYRCLHCKSIPEHRDRSKTVFDCWHFCKLFGNFDQQSRCFVVNRFLFGNLWKNTFFVRFTCKQTILLQNQGYSAISEHQLDLDTLL